MALPTINIDDFKGWVKIVANQFKEVDLDGYVARFREQYLRQIVGAGAYFDIETQTRQKWDDLLNGVTYEDAEGKRQYFEGLKKALVTFIYFEFVRDNFTGTQVGKVKGKAENSERSTANEVLDIARSRFNSGVLFVADMPCFLEAYKEISEEVENSTDNTDNTYTLSISDTKYLEAGDPLEVDGVEYDAVSVATDTNVVIDAGQTGLDFKGSTVLWRPYDEIEFCAIEPSPI